MMPIRNFKELLDNWEIIESNQKDCYIFLLYSNSDIEIAKHIKETFWDLDRMSGGRSLIFLIEKLPLDWNRNAQNRNYWQNFYKDKNVDEWFREVTPFEQTEVYDIAKKFDIPLTDLPCLVIFKNINDKNILTYRLSNNWDSNRFLTEFRSIFEIIQSHDLNKALQGLRRRNIGNNIDNFTRKILKNPIVETIKDCL